MKSFKKKYLSEKKGTALRILGDGEDYRYLFEEEKWEYIRLALPGDKGDVILSDPHNWAEIASNSADVLISGQRFGQIPYFWETMKEIARILKPGGLCCITAPSSGQVQDYWGFYPNGFKALARYAGLEILEVSSPEKFRERNDSPTDIMLIAKKPEIKKQHITKDHIYQRDIRQDGEDSLTKIIRFIRPGTKILELGPATGYLTRYMKEELNCCIDCIEISAQMAETAKAYSRKMLVADLDETDLEAHFEPHFYDYVILADVLEHLKKGEETLISCRNLLKADGRMILSIPNMAHASIIGSLLKGKFEYRDEGLLDKTHLRFFTRQSIEDLLEVCGFSAEVIETLQKLPEDTEIGDSLSDLPAELQQIIFNREDALTYQFIILCKPNHGGGAEKKKPDSASVRDLRRSYIAALNERISEACKALSYAQELAYERLEKIGELEKELAYAQKLAYERLEKIGELEKELAYAQKLAYERLEKIGELEKELAYAQKLAYERLDIIKAIHEGSGNSGEF
jgi:2-polyprenyl-3-methyl-5-hydroxy-6-metoxy-1,4-benzoquinol methylase